MNESSNNRTVVSTVLYTQGEHPGSGELEAKTPCIEEARAAIERNLIPEWIVLGLGTNIQIRGKHGDPVIDGRRVRLDSWPADSGDAPIMLSCSLVESGINRNGDAFVIPDSGRDGVTVDFYSANKLFTQIPVSRERWGQDG